MSDRPNPPTDAAPDDEEEEKPFWWDAVNDELASINPDGSGHDKFPPYASFPAGTFPPRGMKPKDEETEAAQETDPRSK